MQDARFGLGKVVRLAEPLPLDSGVALAPVDVAYETYGTLNAERSNAVLICHALTGDQHVASVHPVTGKPGWWERMVGPGKPIDPARHFIVCSNVLGSCLGTSGPASIDPATGAPWRMRFPVITVRDMARAQTRLLDHLGVERLLAVVGGSMGGMQAMEWAACWPDRVRSAVLIATAARHSAQNIAFHEVGRQAIMADPKWNGGDYYDADPPADGLAVARMAAHITYLSEEGLTEKFGRRLQARDALSFGFDADFQVESYLRHQGLSFVERFDANSYLYITRALDYFDLGAEHGGRLAEAFRGTRTRFCVISFDTDWLYPTAEARHLVTALNAGGAHVSFVELASRFGHDAFLLESPALNRVVDGFLRAAEGGVMPSAIRLSDDKAELQVDVVHGWLASSYWSPGIERALVERAVAGSHCLGAYDGGAQVGFARMITDHATFAWLADVWIDAPARGQGLGREMVDWFIRHPSFAGIRRIGLVTRDAHGVYEASGFHALLRPERYMERLAPEFAQMLREAP